jgi:hypothetical protein
LAERFSVILELLFPKTQNILMTHFIFHVIGKLRIGGRQHSPILRMGLLELKKLNKI